MDTIIRQYRVSDQPQVFEISADTAFFGDPVEAFLEDRRLYIDAFARYYTQYETPFVWIAENRDGIIGFLFGCRDTTEQAKQYRGYIISKVLTGAFMGKYRLGKHTASFVLGMLASLLRGENARTDIEQFPAHLQIDVKQEYRGMGIGRQLIEAYLEQLRGLGVTGVHLETTDHNQAACHLYQQLGFQLLDERKNHFWTRLFGFQVNNRSYGLTLS